MRLKDYISKRKCEKNERYHHLVPEDYSKIAMNRALKEVVQVLFSVFGSTTISVEKSDVVLTVLRKTIASYQREWYKSDREFEATVLLAEEVAKRFSKHFSTFLIGKRIVEVNKKVELSVEEDGIPLTLEEHVHLIVEDDNGTMAVMLRRGKNSSGKSLGGKSHHTRIDYDFRNVATKLALEEEYPGIRLCLVFLKEGESKGKLSGWLINSTAKSNIVKMDYEDFYENGKLEADVLLGIGNQVLIYEESRKQQEKCRGCLHERDCKMQTLSKRKKTERRVSLWNVPKYDEKQQEFIKSDISKETLICAGPGAGKTATLIGRVLYLKNIGYPTEKILMISYTDKAAGEMSERLRGHLAEDEMPKIGTLHSIANGILILERMFLKQPQYKLLTMSRKKRLVKEVLDEIPMLTNVQYGNYEDGPYSTLSMVYNNLESLIKDPESFYEKKKDYIPAEWEHLKECVEKKQREQNYITYEDIIALATKTLKNCPQIQTYIHQMYDCIMVDEYQDISCEKEELIMELLNNKRNLVCIGDDDQTIYTFTGSCSEFFTQFEQRHRGCVKYSLTTNYRSTKNIIQTTNAILGLMDEKSRIAKMIYPNNAAKEGHLPLYYDNNSYETVQACISKMLENGLSLSDIAIIATKNATLSALKEHITEYPTELASAMLVDDFVFQVLYHSLGWFLESQEERRINHKIRLGYLFEMDTSWFEKKSGGRVDGILAYCQEQLAQEMPCGRFVARICSYLNMDESVSEEALLELSFQCQSMSEFYELLSDMYEFGDTKKIEYPIHDKVTLITAHSCKGKEWKGVIVYDCDAYEAVIAKGNNNSMDLRLFYVSCSRAQEMLCLMKEYGSITIVDDTESIRSCVKSA